MLGQPEKCFKYGFDHRGKDLSETPIHDVSDPKKCQEMCLTEPRCHFFAVNSRDDPKENNGCWLKSGGGKLEARTNVIFGPKICEGKLLIFTGNYTYVLEIQRFEIVGFIHVC